MIKINSCTAWCDGKDCNLSYTFSGTTQQTEKFVFGYGWVRYRGKLYCPDCQGFDVQTQTRTFNTKVKCRLPEIFFEKGTRP